MNLKQTSSMFSQVMMNLKMLMSINMKTKTIQKEKTHLNQGKQQNKET
jgi:hypothetical protein